MTTKPKKNYKEIKKKLNQASKSLPTKTPEMLRFEIKGVEKLYLAGISAEDMPDILMSKLNIELSVTRCRDLIHKIQQRYLEEDTKQYAHNKSKQMRRVEEEIRLARSKENLSALAKFESLYADLAGTREPIRVSHEIRISETIQIMISSLDEETLTRYLSEAKEMQKLANNYKQIMLLANNNNQQIIEVENENESN